MKNEITNCGLIALRNISTLRDISVRTLLYMANDNGIKLYPYKVPLDKINTVPFPAILHANDHFVYVSNISDLKGGILNGYRYSGNVLLTAKSNEYEKIPAKSLKTITGSSWAAVAVGAGTLIYGAVQKGAANKRLKRLMKQQTPYQAPDPDLLNMAQNQAQTGYGANTLSYLTNQQDKALSSSLGSVAKLGGDPNDVSDIFSRNVEAIMKTSADSELLQLQKFGKLYDTVAGVQNEQKAVWADQEARLKNQMASEAMAVQAGSQTMNSGINTALGGVANYGISKLYGDEKTKIEKKYGAGAANYAETNNLSFRQYESQLKNQMGNLGNLMR